MKKNAPLRRKASIILAVEESSGLSKYFIPRITKIITLMISAINVAHPAPIKLYFGISMRFNKILMNNAIALVITTDFCLLMAPKRFEISKVININACAKINTFNTRAEFVKESPYSRFTIGFASIVKNITIANAVMRR